ncbi:MAG: hypothetical protein KatS3mg015_2907 [Fimbriimonadales bacterium]|nr:MAG: hypothetical protein KatS3mg015_2907 [Fimbriimonadales bacterium]
MTRDRARQLLERLARPMPAGALDQTTDIARRMFFRCELDPTETDTAAAVRLTALLILQHLLDMAEPDDREFLSVIAAGHARVFTQLTEAMPDGGEEEGSCAGTVVIVTRHAGAVEWLARRGITGTVIEHASPDDVHGKIVVGVVPLDLAALADEVWVIGLPHLPVEWRGRDLTADEMDEAGARLTHYRVSRTDDPPYLPRYILTRIDD